MGRSTEHVGAAIFAAEGSARHRTVRIAVAAGGALLAAWLIALALGVMGGFDSLPGLPSAQSNGSHEASSPAHRTDAPSSMRVLSQEAAQMRTVAPKPASGGSTSAPSPGSTHAPSAGTVTQQPSTSSTSSSTSSSAGAQGQSAAHTSQTTGKPTGSPGNGSGGSGAPGQLR